MTGKMLAALVTAAALGLAGCGGDGHPTPQVAKLPTSAASTDTSAGGATSSGGAGNGSPPPPAAKGNPTALLDEWATCMHSHGDPHQTDPTINADKSITIEIPRDAEALSGEVHDGTAPCNQYLAAATHALRDGEPLPTAPSNASEVRFAQCMRANGYPTYPDPSGDKTDFRGTGIDPQSPAVQNTATKCDKQVGLSTAAPDDAGVVQVISGAPPGGPGGNGGPIANQPTS